MIENEKENIYQKTLLKMVIPMENNKELLKIKSILEMINDNELNARTQRSLFVGA